MHSSTRSAYFQYTCSAPRSMRGSADSRHVRQQRGEAIRKVASTSNDRIEFGQLCARDGSLQLAQAIIRAPENSDRGWDRRIPTPCSRKGTGGARAASSLVTTMPPSPLVMCLPCCRLKAPIRPIVPTHRPCDARQKGLRAILDNGNVVFIRPTRRFHQSQPDCRKDA